MGENSDFLDCHETSAVLTALLVLSGRDFDVTECTQYVGLKPTETWRQHQKRLKGRADLANTEWSVGVARRPGDSLNDVVETMLDMVWGKRSLLLQYAGRHALKIFCACNVTIWREPPEYFLSVQVIRRLSDLSADFLLDIFDYREA